MALTQIVQIPAWGPFHFWSADDWRIAPIDAVR
jgi:hypothetical protein